MLHLTFKVATVRDPLALEWFALSPMYNSVLSFLVTGCSSRSDLFVCPLFLWVLLLPPLPLVRIRMSWAPVSTM